ncbi:SDR family NAD(P)-dependent oxidoreductase [Corynebacterium glyciniphilum]|uniref:SDR family NAD(P)-dependent oxidoreductase n=1 Tax=Corynebacterium glyciniphilum TaxID=1404244 RepID=UPI003D9FFBF0
MPEQLEFAGQTALVTGGGGGFGRAISTTLAAGGAHICVVDINADAASATAKAVTDAGWSASIHVCDLTDAEAVQQLIGDVVAAHGRLDIAVNNAGIGGAMVPLGEYPVETWHRVLDINLSSVFYCLRAELVAMSADGKGGSIINTASIMAEVAMPTIGPYVATKHAVNGLTKAAAVEYGPHGIRVNAVAPSFSRVGFTAESITDDSAWDAMAGQHALGRSANPQDIAGAVAWLASDASGFVTGDLIKVDGGFTAV